MHFFVVVEVTPFFHTLSLFRFHLFRKSDCIWSPEPGAKLQFNACNSDEKWQIKMTHVANLYRKMCQGVKCELIPTKVTKNIICNVIYKVLL